MTTDFSHLWLLTASAVRSYGPGMTKSEYLTEHDGIVKIIQMYIDGSKRGRSELMRPAFHPNASFFGYAGEQLAIGIEFFLDWIDKNGPAPRKWPPSRDGSHGTRCPTRLTGTHRRQALHHDRRCEGGGTGWFYHPQYLFGLDTLRSVALVDDPAGDGG